MSNTEGWVSPTIPFQTQAVTEIIGGTGVTITGVPPQIIINATSSGGGIVGLIPGPGISVSGSAFEPAVGNTGTLSVAAGSSNVTVTGGQNAVVDVPTLVKTVTAGTNMTDTGTATDPILNATGVVETITGGTDISVTGTATDVVINYTGTGGGGGSSLIYATVNCTAAALATGGEVVIQASAGSDQYRIVTAYTDASASTDFSGGGGDRDLLITDGTSEYGTISGSLLAGASTISISYTENPAGIFLPLANNVTVASAAGADIVAKYTGGAVDYAAGDVTITLVLQQVAGTPIPSTGFVIARATISQADLATGGTKVIQASTGTDQYVVVNAFTSAAGSTDFSGGGGDRYLLITDGTSEYGTISAPDNASSNSMIYITSQAPPVLGIMLPTANDISTPTVAGADIVAQYTGGTTDYTAGAVVLTMYLLKIA